MRRPGSREPSRAAAGAANETLDLRSANGSVHVWLAGSHNHRDEAVIGLFRSIAAAAPGSYGVMYVLDDDVGCTWERLVMRHGTVSLEADMSLSPHIGVVEDSSSSLRLRRPHIGGSGPRGSTGCWPRAIRGHVPEAGPVPGSRF